jgi:hypothetical protein
VLFLTSAAPMVVDNVQTVVLGGRQNRNWSMDIHRLCSTDVTPREIQTVANQNECQP